PDHPARVRILVRHPLDDRRRRSADRDRGVAATLAAVPAVAGAGDRHPAPGAGEDAGRRRAAAADGWLLRWRRQALVRSGRRGRGAPHDQATPAAGETDEHVLTTVPTARLIASILISDVGFYAEAVLAALIVTALLAPAVASAVISGGGLVWLLGVITVTWRRFNLEYRLTVADAPDGLRLSGGLVSLTSE